MRILRRILAMFLVVAIICSFSVTVFAWTEGQAPGNASGGTGGSHGSGSFSGKPATIYMWRIYGSGYDNGSSDPNNPNPCGFDWAVHSYSQPTTYTYVVDASVQLSGWPTALNWDAPSFSVDNVIKVAELTFTNFCNGDLTKKFTGRMAWSTFNDAYSDNNLSYSGLLSPGRLGRYYSWTSAYNSNILEDPDMVNELHDKGYSWDSYEKWFTNGTTSLYLVGIQRNETWDHHETVNEEGKKVIVKVTGSDDPSDNFDDTGHTAEWYWKNGKTSGVYHGRSGYNETNHEKTVTATYYDVKQKITTKWEESNLGNIQNQETIITYEVTPGGTKSNTIKYNTSQAQTIQIWYRPYNLNTSTVAKDKLVKESYPSFNGTTPLNITIDSMQEIDAGQKFSMLDTNTPQPFKMQFNNGFWGIPTNDIPFYGTSPLSGYLTNNMYNKDKVFNDFGIDGTVQNGVFYKSTNATGAAVVGNQTKQLRWGGIMSASTNSTNATVQFENGTENKKITDVLYNSKGGLFYLRSIIPGEFNFTNGISGRMKPWWEVEYQQARFYEYGVAYWGQINTSGVHAAKLYETNFYTKPVTNTYIQPILYGEVKVETVGGYIG